MISGTLRSAGEFTFTTVLRDASSPAQSVTREFTINVGASGGFSASSTFPAQGIGLVVWDGGTVQEMVAAATPHGVGSFWLTAGGRLVGYTVGAPDFVNQVFLDLYGQGTIAAETPVLVVVP